MDDTQELILTVNDLLLDVDNPRLGLVGSQSEALEAIVNLNPDHFVVMMGSIIEKGLDPGDRLYVIEAEEDGGYVVLEGNRRLSALMVLFWPDLLDGTSLSERIRDQLLEARSGFDAGKVQKIKCICFKDPEAAREWMLTRHTGGRRGEGRIRWGSTEIQRFIGDGSIVDVIDFVGRSATFVEGEWESMKSQIESGKSSVIGRLLESAAGRKHIGISITLNPDGSKTPQLSRNWKWAASRLKKIMEDVIAGDVNSRSHNTAPQIEKYFKSLPRPTGRPVKPRAFKEINIGISQVPLKKPSTSTSTTSGMPSRRKALAPPSNRSFEPPKSPKGDRLLIEATRIKVEDFTISAAFILRAFIELAVNEYMTRELPTMCKIKDGKRYNLTLAKKARLVMEHIIEEGLESEDNMQPFCNNVLNPEGIASIKLLNGFMHGKYHIPTSEALIVGWDSCVPVFDAAFGKV